MKTKTTKPGRIKSAIIKWLGLTHEEWGQYFGKTSDTGEVVTTDKALTLSAVWACTRLISQTIATLPVSVYQRTPNGRRNRDDHQVARLLHSRPNADMTAVVFWESLIANALLQGNGFAEKKRIGGRIVALDPLVPPRLRWQRLPNGQWEYQYTDDDGRVRIIPEEDIFHIPGFTLDGKFGLSVVKYGVQVFGSGLSANKAANRTFANGLQQTTFFKYPTKLRPEQREDAREAIKKLSGAQSAGDPVILEAGMEQGQIGINPDDAQLLESRNFSVEEICRWFGVPPSMVGGGDKASSWASSAENLNLWFLQYGLRPWLKRIEEAVWADLLTPTEQFDHYAEYSVEGLLRADSKARAEFYSTALQNGWMNRSTVARLENLPEIPGGEVFTVQSNLIPLDKLGQTSESEQLRSALTKFLEDKT